MTQPPDITLLRLLPAVVLGVAAAVAVIWSAALLVRYLADRPGVASGAAHGVADQTDVEPHRPPGRAGADREDPTTVVVEHPSDDRDHP